MCLLLRNTLSRGRSTVPVILRRTCRWRRSCRRCLAFCWSMYPSSSVGHWSARPRIRRGVLPLAFQHGRAARLRCPAGEGLAFLTAHLLVFIANALALVRFGRPATADFGGE